MATKRRIQVSHAFRQRCFDLLIFSSVIWIKPIRAVIAHLARRACSTGFACRLRNRLRAYEDARLAGGLLSILVLLMLGLPAAAQTQPRALSPLLDRFGNSCQTLLPCAAMEHLGLFLGTSGQVALIDSKAGRSYTFGGDLSLGFDFIRRVALEARFPIAGLREPSGDYRLVAGPSLLGIRVRLGPAAATLFGTRQQPRYSLLVGAQLAFRLPRAEGDPQYVDALPLGVPQPRVDVAGELNFGPAQVSPSVSVLTEQGGAMLQLGLRISLRIRSGVSVDLEALSRMRAAGHDEAGRCSGGTRGGLGIRGVLATGVMAFAHYSVGSGNCEPTHAAVVGVSFAFGGLPLRRIPTPEEVGVSDFWQRVYLGIADPVLDCNGWMLDDKSLVPLFKFGDPDSADPSLIRSHGEVFRVGEHFDIDRQGRLYRANLLRQPLFGGQRFSDAPISQKRELPVCEQGPRHRFAEHCQVMERTIEMLADAARSDTGPGWTAAMSQRWEFERECLGGKDEEERGIQIADILRLAQLIAKRGRPSSPAGMRGATSERATNGFSSFSAFKRAMGPAGQGKEWHHIVEQTPGNIQRFGGEAVHNTGNVIRLDAELHRRISGYYSSKDPDITLGLSLTVRQWLSTQSFEEQMRFGLKAIRRFGGTP